MSPKKEQIQQLRAQQENDITQCVNILNNGGLILYPTDTVWGIGCDATNAEAVKRVYQLKQRDDSKALIVLIDNADHIDHYVVDVPAIARELIDVAVKPLTSLLTCWATRIVWAYAFPTTSSATSCVRVLENPSSPHRPT